MLDLAFTDDGHLTVLESDLFVFTFDPLADPQAVAAQIDKLAPAREWTFNDAQCQRARRARLPIALMRRSRTADS